MDFAFFVKSKWANEGRNSQQKAGKRHQQTTEDRRVACCLALAALLKPPFFVNFQLKILKRHNGERVV